MPLGCRGRAGARPSDGGVCQIVVDKENRLTMPSASAVALPEAADSPFSRCLRIAGWIALAGLAVGCLAAGGEAVFNVAGGLGALVLLVHGVQAVRSGRPVLAEPLLRLGLGVFAAGLLIGVLAPNLLALPETEPLSRSLHAAWNTVQAVVAAGLCLLLFRTRSDALAFVLLFSLAFFAVAAGGPLGQWMERGFKHMRITGTKGGPNRYAFLLLISTFPAWVLALSRTWSAVELRGRWLWIGGLVAGPALAGFMLHKRMLRMMESHAGSASVVPPSVVLGLLAGVAGACALVWLLLWRPGWTRRATAVTILVVAFVDLALTGARSVITVACLVVLAVAGVWTARWRQRAVLVGLGALLLGGGFYARTRSRPLLLKPERIRHQVQVRAWIFRGGLRVFAAHPILGVGYGTEAFAKHFPYVEEEQPRWRPRSPDVHPRHAHNLWIHLLATQGVVGFVAFHVLWGCVFVFLWRRRKPGLAVASSDNAAQARLPGSDAKDRGTGNRGTGRSACATFGGGGVVCSTGTPACAAGDGSAPQAGVPGLQTALPADRERLNAPVVLGLLALVAVQVCGLAMLPLQEYNEVLSWLVVGLGVAAARMERPGT